MLYYAQIPGERKLLGPFEYQMELEFAIWRHHNKQDTPPYMVLMQEPKTRCLYFIGCTRIIKGIPHYFTYEETYVQN